MNRLLRAWGREWRHLYRDSTVMMVLLGGVLFYAFLYPLPYRHNVPGEQPVVVVNRDHSALARELTRRVDATPEARVVARLGDEDQARDWIAAGRAHGLLVIPAHFQRDVMLGRPTTLSYAGDASYFLIYSRVVEGLLTAGTTLSLETQARRALMQGREMTRVPGELRPVRLQRLAAFNPVQGYIDYVVPAVFVLILHQTLLIAAGCLTARDRWRRGQGDAAVSLRLALPLRLLNFVAIYLLFAMLYFGVFFQYYQVPRHADPLTLLALTTLFLTATTLCALALGYAVNRLEGPTLVVLVSSLPIVFCAGFVWPSQSLPTALRWLADLIPATPGIQAFLKLNQMGAAVHELAPELALMAGQCLGYGALLILLARHRRPPQPLWVPPNQPNGPG